MARPSGWQLPMAGWKVTVTWSGPRVILPKNQIKLMLNLMLLGLEAVPLRGGKIHVTIGDDSERPDIHILADGLNARIPKGSETFLRGVIEKRRGHGCACRAALFHGACLPGRSALTSSSGRMVNRSLSRQKRRPRKINDDRAVSFSLSLLLIVDNH